MYKQISNGNSNNDVEELVNGMKSLLSILEGIKLDVANHQIRLLLRPALIEETTAFEQKFLMKTLRNGNMSIDNAKPWYQDATRTYPAGCGKMSSHFGDMGVLFEGLSRSMLPSTSEKPLPSTFVFDEDRLGRVRSDILNAINLDVCMRMYEDLERTFRPHSDNHDCNSNTPTSSDLQPSSLISGSIESNFSSLQSSLVLPPYMTSDTNASKTRARILRDTLVALLQQAPHDLHDYDQWRAMAPSLALQIFRFTNAPMDTHADLRRS